MLDDRKTFSITILTTFFGGLLVILFFSIPAPVGNSARVYMLDVGQGDSFLIVYPNHKKILIDGGKDASALTELSKIIPWTDRTIDVMIATHPDADHIGGLAEIVKRYHVGLFLTSDVSADTLVYKNLFTTLLKNNVPSYYARAGMKLSFDSTGTEHFDILFPDRDTHTWKTNEASVVGKLFYKNSTALFTGDSPISIEHYLVVKNSSLLASDILKLGHHGSKTSSSLEYLQAVHPQLALISAGVGNSYGHPHQETLDKLATLHIPYLSTQTSGTVQLVTTGDSHWTQQK